MHALPEKKIGGIAITGIIGSGKSTLCHLLREKGYMVLDCDQGSRECIKPGSVGYQQMIDAFSSSILNEQKEIDRAKTAALIFRDPKLKAKVEAIQHPLILEWLYKQRQACPDRLVFVEVPLLFECGWERYFDESWVVVAKDNQVRERLRSARGMSEADIERRLASQMSTQLKMAKADVIIDNSEDIKALEVQIKPLLEKAEQTYGQR